MGVFDDHYMNQNSRFTDESSSNYCFFWEEESSNKYLDFYLSKMISNLSHQAAQLSATFTKKANNSGLVEEPTGLKPTFSLFMQKSHMHVLHTCIAVLKAYIHIPTQ